MILSTMNPTRELHRGGAPETVHAGSLNGHAGTTTFTWSQAFRLARTRALLLDTTAALVLLVFGEARR